MPPQTKKKQQKELTQEEKNAALIAAIPKPDPWLNSKAKQLLRDDIVTGVVSSKMEPKAVFTMRAEYQQYDYNNFVTNLRNLREAIVKDHKRMQKDCEYYGHDRSILPDLWKDREGADDPSQSWHKSEVRKLLKADIDAGKHKQMTYFELYKDRPEYEESPFTWTQFRKHIHQELDERASRKHRIEKKKLRPRGPAPTHHYQNIYDD